MARQIVKEPTLIKCAVVVDSRNLDGQIKRIFGSGGMGTYEGIRRALALHDMDVVRVIVGTATQSASSRPSTQLQAAITKNSYLAKTLRRDGAKVLEGTLADRSGVLEEKQVDVLLALEIADLANRIKYDAANTPFECIVVLSEDQDLLPAIAYADGIGVHCVAAADSTVFRRPGNRHWMVLGEQFLLTAAELEPAVDGHPHRRYLSGLAVNGASSCTNWKAGWEQPAGEVTLSNNRDALGIAAVTHRVRRGDRFALAPVGMRIDDRSKRGMPHFLLGAAPVSGLLPGVHLAMIRHWTSPNEITVELLDRTCSPTGRERRLTVPAHPLQVGQVVSVLEQARQSGTGYYYIGPVGHPTPPLSALASPVNTVTVLRVATGGGWHLCEATGGERVVVHAEYLTHVKPGDALQVIGTGAMAATGMPTAMPLTCC